MLRQLPSLEQEFTVVTKLFTLIRDFDIVMEEEELALYQTLMPTFTHLKVNNILRKFYILMIY